MISRNDEGLHGGFRRHWSYSVIVKAAARQPCWLPRALDRIDNGDPKIW